MTVEDYGDTLRITVTLGITVPIYSTPIAPFALTSYPLSTHWLEDFQTDPHLLSQVRLRRMASLSKFVRGALAGLAAPGVGGYPSRRGSDEKASG
jgi:hypothetical protein